MTTIRHRTISLGGTSHRAARAKAPNRRSGAGAQRGSQALRRLLQRHALQDRLTLGQILATMNDDAPSAALMVCAVSSISPIPGLKGIGGAPILRVGAQMMKGRQDLKLPTALLARSVPRRALALAIHAILPVLDKAERVMRPRWLWLTSPGALRVIGLLVFLIALPLAFPILGFHAPHATSLSTLAVGLLERDGVAVTIGLLLGVASLVFVTARGFRPDALKTKLRGLIRATFTLGTIAKAAVKRIIRSVLTRWFVRVAERPRPLLAPTGGVTA